MKRLRSETTPKIGGSNSGDLEDDTIRTTTIEIPHDLTAEVLARLPAKSLARFLCVSKLWASTIRNRDFMESFMTHSSTRPCLLINLMDIDYKKIFFYSSLYPRNGDHESSSLAIREAILPNSHGYLRNTMFNSVRGLICLRSFPRFMVCNPTTRGFVILPEIESKQFYWVYGYGFFGYDPIENQYKVLWVTRPDLSVDGRRSLDYEIQVFTLGDREWRRIEGIPLHFPRSNGVCINGVVYYRAHHRNPMQDTVVSFDVRSEKFKFMEVQRCYGIPSLMNFEGRLYISYLDEIRKHIVSLVLEDPEEEEWSKKIYVLPGSVRDLVGDTVSRFNLSATAAGDIILAPHHLSIPLCLIYYNPRRNSLSRVEMEGIEDHGFTLENEHPVCTIHTFSDHFESIMFL